VFLENYAVFSLYSLCCLMSLKKAWAAANYLEIHGGNGGHTTAPGEQKTLW